MKALEYNPDYFKSKFRAANCCLELERFEDCFRLCHEMLNVQPLNQQINDLIGECASQKVRTKSHQILRFMINLCTLF